MQVSDDFRRKNGINFFNSLRSQCCQMRLFLVNFQTLCIFRTHFGVQDWVSLEVYLCMKDATPSSLKPWISKDTMRFGKDKNHLADCK